MITTVEQAQLEVAAIRADYEADAYDAEVEIDHTDVVVSACHGINSDDICRELCRIELGFIPFDLERRLGKYDWIDS